MHPISYFQAVILGLTQGVAEPFPVSSLGHAVVLPELAGWNIHQNDNFFLTFLVATHLATALVLLGFFWQDWVRIVKGLWRSLRLREIRADDTDARLGWLLVAGTIPAGIIGLLLQDPLRKLFASPPSAAAFLIVNGIALIALRAAAQAPAPARATISVTAMRASPNSAGARRSRWVPRRPPRSCPASRALGSRWAVGSWWGSPTRTPRATRFCSPRR